jgi:hypothetical protein
MTQTRNFLKLSDDNTDMTQVTGLPFNADEISDQLLAFKEGEHPVRKAIQKDLEDGKESLSSEAIETIADMVDKYLPEGTDFQKGYFFGTLIQATRKIAQILSVQTELRSLQDLKEKLINLETDQH